MNKILVVDDQEPNLYLLKSLLEGHGYGVVEAQNGAQALELARADAPDLIVSDILMPVMDGFSLCQEWMKDETLRAIPFVFYTATYTDPKDEQLALSLGAARFIVKPVETDEFIAILEQVFATAESGALSLPGASLQPDMSYYRMYNEVLVRKLEAKMIELEQANRALEDSNTSLGRAYDATIEGWSRAMDLRDKETEGHTQRVTELTVRLAREMGIPDSEITNIRRGGLLHDIGKLGVPDRILFKNERLTEAELTIMRRHPSYAYEMLSAVEYLKPALDIPYCHHEKWDGSGYPRGLKGEQIPFPARIFAVVDVWDALTSDRPYRPAWDRAQALEYIREQAGSYFDPQVVEVFLKLI